MPELPEVEVVRATLDHDLKGRRIEKIDCYYLPIIEETEAFIKLVSNQRIVRVDRYAKYLIF